MQDFPRHSCRECRRPSRRRCCRCHEGPLLGPQMHLVTQWSPVFTHKPPPGKSCSRCREPATRTANVSVTCWLVPLAVAFYGHSLLQPSDLQHHPPGLELARPSGATRSQEDDAVSRLRKDLVFHHPQASHRPKNAPLRRASPHDGAAANGTTPSSMGTSNSSCPKPPTGPARSVGGNEGQGPQTASKLESWGWWVLA